MFSWLLEYILRSGIAGLCGKCMFNFIRSCHTVLRSGWNILPFPLAVFESSGCSTSSPALGIVHLFNFSHSSVYVTVISLWFYYVFLWRLVLLRIFLCVYWPFTYLLGSVSLYPFQTVFFKNWILPIKKILNWLSYFWVCSLCILGTIPSLDIFSKNFLPICGLPFS